MHPEVTSDTPGRCPNCGMKLLAGQPTADHGDLAMDHDMTMDHHDDTAMDHGRATAAPMGSSGRTTWSRSTARRPRPPCTGGSWTGPVVVGGGQAGLAMAWHLQRQGLRFVALKAGPELGHTWRNRWDSLKLFTPAQYDALPGMAFPAPADTYPTKDPVADYLQAYAATRQVDLSVAPTTGCCPNGWPAVTCSGG
jgi:hypothetical protein